MNAAARNAWPFWTARRARGAACAAIAVIAALGAVLFARRLAGALTAPLAAGPLAVTLLVATAVVVAARLAWQSPARRAAFAWCGAIALAMLFVAIAPPSIHSAAWLLWLPLACVEHLSRKRFLTPVSAPTRGGLSASAVRLATPPCEGDDAERDFVLQDVTRICSADGVESIRGTLTAAFAAGQRHAALHVGFCPPLEQLPTIEVELVDGPDAAVKVSQALAHGAQFEVRLAEPAEDACTITLEFSAAPPVSPMVRLGR